MNVSTKIELDTRSQKKDGTFPLKLLIVIDRKPLRISMGYSLPKSDWNEKTQSVKSSSKVVENTTRLNSKLQKDKTKAMEIITQLIDSGEINQLSNPEIKSRITKKDNNETHLLAFFNFIITEMEVAGNIGNARVYKMVRGSMANFLDKKDIPLSKITYKWLKKYEVWYLSKGNGTNGLAVNMRTLRALLNKAIKRKILSKDSYPFDTYSIKKETTKKRAIKQVGIEALINYQPKTEKEERAKDYFLISFYLMGASFVDLAFLKVGDIKDGRVEYKRKKTGKLHSIKITDALQKILDKYLVGKKSDDFVLEVIKTKYDKKSFNNIRLHNGHIEYQMVDEEASRRIQVTEELKEHLLQHPSGKNRQEFLLSVVMNAAVKRQHMDIRNELRLYNNCIREMGKEVGIDHKITSYVARHSFATIAKYKEVPVSVISQALGHSDVKTTEVYLAEFDNEIMDKYNEIITGS